MNYAKTAASVLRLLAKYGQPVTLRTYTDGGYNTSTSANTITQADTTRTGAVLNFGQGVTTVSGEMVVQGDQRLLLDAAGPTPDPQDHIIANGQEYAIVSCSDVNPAGVAVVYDIHLRRM